MQKILTSKLKRLNCILKLKTSLSTTTLTIILRAPSQQSAFLQHLPRKTEGNKHQVEIKIN